MARFEEEKQIARLAKLRRKEEEDAVKLLAGKLGLPYADLSTVPINTDALGLVPESEAKDAELAVIQKAGRRIDIAVRNPELPKTKTALEGFAGHNLTANLFLVSLSSLKRAWVSYANIARRGHVISGEVEVSAERLKAFHEQARSLTGIAALLGNIETKRATDILEIILAGAIGIDASDIHLEPQADTVRVRYRLDGVLADAAMLPPASYHFVLSRIKLISDIKLNVRTRGQDGRFTIKVEGIDMEIRVSTLPGPYGENLVLRVLNPKNISITYAELGMQPWVERIMAKELSKPNGMILTTGPTGSGKTTTLYTFIREIHKPDIKIITLEDPIEYRLTGIEQTQVEAQSGYDFASGLRSILRQDPDVILVGEIRDMETAHTAMNAALTGHLVFSTLHTNNAAGTIPRLLDLGVDPAIVAPAINVSMAQRLLRKLCKTCKQERQASEEESHVLKAEIDGLPAGIPKPELAGPLTLFKATGCTECNGTGYKGRVGIYEIILIDDVIEQLISHRPTEVEVKEAARSQGQITMRQDGILKVLSGITDADEVDRVVSA